MFLVLGTFETCGQTRKRCFRNKMFLNLLGNIFASWEANFVSATMFAEVGKQVNIDRKHNVFATMFPSLPWALLFVYFFTAVEVLCEGSCRVVEFIGKGLCHILDVAVIALKAAEIACGWISAAINFVLTKLFIIHRYVAGIQH